MTPLYLNPDKYHLYKITLDKKSLCEILIIFPGMLLSLNWREDGQDLPEDKGFVWGD